MGIQQKLHTKLVQKLILTPSLQQAIKLLPMSTLELSDLLNQEMVENPMLEEVPTEELQPAETQQTQEKTEPEQQANKTDTWDDQDYEYFFGDYLDDGYRPRAPQEVKELPPIENTLDRKSTRLNSSHSQISYAVFCLKKKTNDTEQSNLVLFRAIVYMGSTLGLNLVVECIEPQSKHNIVLGVACHAFHGFYFGNQATE